MITLDDDVSATGPTLDIDVSATGPTLDIDVSATGPTLDIDVSATGACPLSVHLLFILHLLQLLVLHRAGLRVYQLLRGHLHLQGRGENSELSNAQPGGPAGGPRGGQQQH